MSIAYRQSLGSGFFFVVCANFLAGAVVAGAGCSGAQGPIASIQVANRADATSRCDPMRPGNADRLLHAPVQTVRLTMRGTDDAGHTALDSAGKPVLCDHVVQLGDTASYLRLGAGNATRVDIFAEAFAPDAAVPGGFQRVASGAAYGLLRDKVNFSKLTLYPTQDFSCASTRLSTPRAFHSATQLPDGRVLFVGGLVGTDSKGTFDTMTGVSATGSAELYDPLEQTITGITEITAPTGRAFHSATVLSSSPCPQAQLGVLLVGGLSPTAANLPMLNQTTGGQGGRLVPFSFIKALGAKAAKNEILCLDLEGLTGTRLPLGGTPAAFRAVDVGSRGLVAAGGIDYDSAAKLNSVLPQTELASFPLTGAAPATSNVVTGRSGASLSLIDDEKRAVVWGGGAYTDALGELVSNLDTTPVSTPISLTPLTPSIATQFHTATKLAGGAVLLTGGFQVTPGGTNTQPPVVVDALRTLALTGDTPVMVRVGLGNGYTIDATCATNDQPHRYRPAGWESAVVLADGRVLVSGGSPSGSTMTIPAADGTATVRCQDCVDGSSPLCAIPQTSLFDPATNTLTAANNGRGTLAPLGVARFGHTSTRLGDGSVLVVGGIGSEAREMSRQPIMVNDIEIYNPHAVAATTATLDPSDPVFTDLSAASLARAPNGQVTASGATTPYADCSTF